MTEKLIVEVGKYYKNRSGNIGFCIGENPFKPKDNYSRFVIIYENNYVEAVGKNGQWGECIPAEYDLVSEVKLKRKLTGFLNIYGGDEDEIEWCNAELTKEEAERYTARGRIACLDLSKYDIEFEEGEGL